MRSRLFFLGMVERSFPIPEDLQECLEENAPQALLRDLHRPATRFQVDPHELVKMGHRSRHADHIREIKKTLAVDFRVRMDRLTTLRAMVREDRTDLRRILRSDWTQAPKMAVESRPLNAFDLAKFFE